jgi:hypothetical protein
MLAWWQWAAYFGVVNGAVKFLDLSDMSTSNLCAGYRKTNLCPALSPLSNIQMSLISEVSEW